MKKIKFIISILTLQLICTTLHAKENSFKTIPEKVKAGDEITIIYNPANTNLADAKNIDIVYSLYSQRSTELTRSDTHNLAMVREGANWKVKIKASDITDIIAVKFMAGDIADNNEDAGYFIKFYDNNGNETIGSILGYASAITSWTQYLQFAAIDQKKSLEIMNKVFAAHPELKAKYCFDYLTALNNTIPDKEKADVLKKELSEIEKSSELTDSDYYTIAYYYKNINIPEKEAETKNNAIKKFPKGKIAFNERMKEQKTEKDIDKQKEIAIRIQNDFPEYGKYEVRPKGQVLLEIINQGKHEMLKEWWDYIKDKNWAGIESYGYYADKLLGNEKDLEVVLEICKQGEALWDKEKVTPSVKLNYMPEYLYSNIKKGDEASLYIAYAKVLTGLKRNEEAVEKYKKAFSLQPVDKFTENVVKAAIKFLFDQKKYETVQPIIEDAISAGIQADDMKDGLKGAYLQKNNNENGFDSYYNKLVAEGKEKFLTNMKKKLINQPAPQFALTDLDGKTVSLTDLKGKVVIVDFWATWCGPCKASFPAMQKAVNKFKDNKDVVFLFINTWQTELDKKKNAEDFIKETKYSFHVLLDTENKVVADFKVGGIPTKFVLDKNGNIRFNVVGFTGSDDITVKELSTMIELASK